MTEGKKFFNTVGAINPQKHYFIPHRLNWDQLIDFIEKEYYFVLHAPRQSGKTTAIKEFVTHLNQEKKYVALYFSVEAAHLAANDVKRASIALLEYFVSQIDYFFPQETEVLVYLNIDVVISGEGENQDFFADDVQYAEDLGLISHKEIIIANPIYQEIIPRALALSK